LAYRDLRQCGVHNLLEIVLLQRKLSLPKNLPVCA
jgi:hypothetical protein